MTLRLVVLGVTAAFAFAVPVRAQSTGAPLSGAVGVLQNSFSGPRLASLAPPPLRAGGDAAENPGVTSSAKAAYERLAAGRLDRSKLTAAVDRALPDELVASASQRLTALGTPSWSFVRNAESSAGTVSIYQLRYANAVEYLTFGVGDSGVVYALSLGSAPPS
jgi:hypothetical protein